MSLFPQQRRIDLFTIRIVFFFHLVFFNLQTIFSKRVTCLEMFWFFFVKQTNWTDLSFQSLKKLKIGEWQNRAGGVKVKINPSSLSLSQLSLTPQQPSTARNKSLQGRRGLTNANQSRLNVEQFTFTCSLMFVKTKTANLDCQRKNYYIIFKYYNVKMIIHIWGFN